MHGLPAETSFGNGHLAHGDKDLHDQMPWEQMHPPRLGFPKQVGSLLTHGQMRVDAIAHGPFAGMAAGGGQKGENIASASVAVVSAAPLACQVAGIYDGIGPGVCRLRAHLE
jgi:hypothetical protein